MTGEKGHRWEHAQGQLDAHPLRRAKPHVLNLDAPFSFFIKIIYLRNIYVKIFPTNFHRITTYIIRL